MKTREWEISTRNDAGEWGTFRFAAENKALAHDHALTLQADPGFVAKHGEVMYSGDYDESVRAIAVRMVGWCES